jgi:predicted RNase H-like HicB family nuclease
MKTYTVTVKISLLEFYEVKAETPEEAMENWDDGVFLYSDDTFLDAKSLKVKESKRVQPV